MSVNARLRDEAIAHAIDQRRYSQYVVQRVIAALNRQDSRLAAALAEALDRMDATSFTVERLEAMLASVRAINAQAHAAAMAELQEGMRGMARAATVAQQQALATAIPAAVLAQQPLVGMSWEAAYAAALSRPFQGRLLSGWAENVEASRMTAIRNAVRQGYMDGLTTDQIVRSIRGTRARQYADGVLERSRREVQTIVRTALAHTAQTARTQLYLANADLIKARRWDATLDTRTSEGCRIRDGKLYTNEEHPRPIGHSIPWLQGPGRLHFNCRSVDVPVTKSWRELGIDADDLPAGARASMDGAVPGDTTFGEWLARQPPDRQDEVLGPERARLLRAGKVKFADLYDDRGRPLTLAELLAKLGG